jgi:RNA polymerase sigma-70 factor (ECF subfamily)
MTPDPEEAELVERLRARDPQAFAIMVRRHQHQVYGLALRMLGNPAEAEDLAQEVFISVFKAIDRFRSESRFSTWLYRIATNHAHNRAEYLHRRHYGRQDSIDDLVEREPDRPLGEPGPRPDRELEGQELERIVQEGLAQIDPDHREVLILRDIEHLSDEEIAEVLGVAEGTVKSRLFRARYALKQRIAARYAR